MLVWIQPGHGDALSCKEKKRSRNGAERGTHTLRHIETRDRLKIAAKIDGERIMLKASGQWRHAYRNTPEREFLFFREIHHWVYWGTKTNNIHFSVAHRWHSQISHFSHTLIVSDILKSESNKRNFLAKREEEDEEEEETVMLPG